MKTSMTYEMPSQLEGKTIDECRRIAIDIAAETFIKNGNRAIPFTDNNELRIAFGACYKSFPDLAKVMIAAYNEMQAELIIANM